MKMLKRILASVLTMTVITAIASAQSFKSDPTFSSQNYKHPNKAKKAADVQKKLSASVGKEEYVRPSDNYKASNKVFNRIPITVVTNFTSQKEAVERNYKQSFRPRPAVDRDEQIRRFLEEISVKNREDESKEAESD